MSFASQISNRNFLSPGGFRFTLAKYPKVAYFAQMANVPGISLGLVEQPTPYRSAYIDGGLEYSKFNLQFIVDENLENYLIIHNWMRALGVPDNFAERAAFEESSENYVKGSGAPMIFADGTLSVLNSNFRPIYNVVFKDMKPVELSTLDFDGTLTDQEYFQAVVTFDYLSYEIQSLEGTRLTNLS